MEHHLWIIVSGCRVTTLATEEAAYRRFNLAPVGGYYMTREAAQRNATLFTNMVFNRLLDKVSDIRWRVDGGEASYMWGNIPVVSDLTIYSNTGPDGSWSDLLRIAVVEIGMAESPLMALANAAG